MAQSEDFLSQFHLENGINSDDFMKIWKNYDTDQNGYIEAAELDRLIRDLMKEAKEEVTVDVMEEYKKHILTFFDLNHDGRLDLKEMIKMFPVKDEVPSSSDVAESKEIFLGQIRSATGIHSADFIKIWKKYDTDKNGYIEASELDIFLRDLMKEDEVTETIQEYKQNILQLFDINLDGKLDLKEMANLLPVEENFIEKFKAQVSLSLGDFNKIFQHYDRDNNGEIDGDEIPGFIKDVLESSGSNVDIQMIEDYTETFKDIFDKNKDDKFNKDELMMMFPIDCV